MSLLFKKCSTSYLSPTKNPLLKLPWILLQSIMLFLFLEKAHLCVEHSDYIPLSAFCLKIEMFLTLETREQI